MESQSKSSREILKLVDQLVKSNNLEQALEEVRKARELDPKNIYTFAYEERIKELLAQRKEKEPLKSGTGGEVPFKQSGDKSYNLKEYMALEEKKGPELYEEFKKIGLQSSDKAVVAEKKGASKEAKEIYKQALLLAWSDGKKNEEEERELQDLRRSLGISDDEHKIIDRQAQLECYILLLKYLLQSNASKTEVSSYLADLRKSFDVSSSEHAIIEENLKMEKSNKEKKHLIVLIDDDKQLLNMMKDTIEHERFAVKDFLTSDEAFEYLKKESADCILCDISLETSSMNGFVFYEKIRELRHLQQVPFIFITALNDIVLMRIGKEMGIDDFLVKPIHRDNLIATIRGKIKRFEQIRILRGL